MTLGGLVRGRTAERCSPRGRCAGELTAENATVETREDPGHSFKFILVRTVT